MSCLEQSIGLDLYAYIYKCKWVAWSRGIGFIYIVGESERERERENERASFADSLSRMHTYMHIFEGG